MSNKFGNNSKAELKTCHEDLIKIMTLAISLSDIDFGITEGHRSIDRQQLLYNQGKSQIDGINKKGKHNYYPSLAGDIYTYHPEVETRRKLAYDKVHLSYIAGVITASAKMLYQRGEISHIIRWGANWDSDGVIDYDQSFDDYPHFELIKP
jgi:peptidoglycan L-alanyl-D-glutamate endopeptidase CwlK